MDPFTMGVALLSLAVATFSLMWEAIVKPSRDRKALRAALAAELADSIKYLDAIVEAGRRNRGEVPPNFHISTQVFVALAAELGTLRPLLVARLVSVYRQFNELNWAPQHSKDLDASLASSESAPTTQWIQNQLARHADTFFDMVTKVRVNAQLAVAELGGVPEKPAWKQIAEGQMQVTTSLENVQARAEHWRRPHGEEQ